jgi:hypothetical protein
MKCELGEYLLVPWKAADVSAASREAVIEPYCAF